MAILRLTVLIVCCLVGMTITAQAADVQTGTTVGGGFFQLPQAQRDVAYAHMHQVGITTIRTDASWGYFERTQGVYQTEQYDAIAHELAGNGFKWLPILDYSAEWAGLTPGNPFSRPADFNTYAAFAERFVRRYGAGGELAQVDPVYAANPITEVELWNEPNSDQFWREQATGPVDYGAMVILTSARIRAVNPGVQIVLGGLLDSGPDAKAYLQQLLTAYPQLFDSVDRLGWHPYRYYSNDILNSVAAARRILDAAGYRNTLIDITEMGWTTGMVQPADITTTLRTLRSGGCGVNRVVVYTWQGSGGLWDITNPDGSLTAVGVGVTDGMAQPPIPNLRCMAMTDGRDTGYNNDGDNASNNDGSDDNSDTVVFGNKRGADKRTKLAYTWIRAKNRQDRRLRSQFSVRFTNKTNKNIRRQLNGQRVTLSCNGTVEKSRLDFSTMRRWGKKSRQLVIALKTLPQSGVCDLTARNKIIMTFTMK